jgi:hypothetical protein
MLSACAPGFKVDPRTISGIDPVFQPYIDEYIAYKDAPLNYYIPIQFTDLSGYTVGLCTRWSTGERQIQIDKAYWDAMTEGERIQTIAHELGHCDLNRDHLLNFKNGTPVSIMYPYMFELYPSTILNYMKELFNPGVTTMATSLASETDCVKDIKVE